MGGGDRLQVMSVYEAINFDFAGYFSPSHQLIPPLFSAVHEPLSSGPGQRQLAMPVGVRRL